jgi:hypothetical protein
VVGEGPLPPQPLRLLERRVAVAPRSGRAGRRHETAPARPLPAARRRPGSPLASRARGRGTPGWDGVAYPMSDRSAAELARHLPFLGVAQGEVKVRQTLRTHSCFCKVWRDAGRSARSPRPSWPTSVRCRKRPREPFSAIPPDSDHVVADRHCLVVPAQKDMAHRPSSAFLRRPSAAPRWRSEVRKPSSICNLVCSLPIPSLIIR